MEVGAREGMEYMQAPFAIKPLTEKWAPRQKTQRAVSFEIYGKLNDGNGKSGNVYRENVFLDLRIYSPYVYGMRRKAHVPDIYEHAASISNFEAQAVPESCQKNASINWRTICSQIH